MECFTGQCETVDYEVQELSKAECRFTNEYSGYFATDGAGDNYLVPSGLVAYFSIDVTTKDTGHDKVVITFNGVEKPGSDIGVNSVESCYVSTGATKADKDNCAWTGSTTPNKELTVTTTEKEFTVRL